MHGAKIIQIDGNFDDCLELARKLTADFPTISLVNSVNPFRIEGQKTAAFEIVDALGTAPDVHALPVGNAGNITAYWKGYTEYHRDGLSDRLPRMLGTQAAGAAPLVLGRAGERARRPSPPRSGSARRRRGRRRSRPSSSPTAGSWPPPTRRSSPRITWWRAPRGVRRAGVGGQHRRPAQVDRGRLGGNGLHGGVHGDRQRAQGPRHRAQGHARPSRRFRSIPSPWSPSWGWSSGVDCR